MIRRHKRRRQPDPRQLLLFTQEEMAGEPLSPDHSEPANQENQENQEDQEKTEGIEDIGKPEKPERPEKPENPENPEKPEPPEDLEKPESPEKPEKPEPPEDPENPEKERPAPAAKTDIVELLVGAMQLLSHYSPGEVRLIAMQTAALMQGDIGFELPYRVPAINGYEMRGDMLAALAYVSIAQSFPNMTDSIGLNWEKEYSEAKARYSNS